MRSSYSGSSVCVPGYGRDSAGEYVLNIHITPFSGEVCWDGVDNDGDGDGLVDCDDEDCDGHPDCRCWPEPELGSWACTDGIDNDCDGLIDGDDCAVVAEVGECCDGWDNNGNGVVDEFACRCYEDWDYRGASEPPLRVNTRQKHW